jgi:hypothetical protein
MIATVSYTLLLAAVYVIRKVSMMKGRGFSI